jgi:hypothetical protein
MVERAAGKALLRPAKRAGAKQALPVSIRAVCRGHGERKVLPPHPAETSDILLNLSMPFSIQQDGGCRQSGAGGVAKGVVALTLSVFCKKYLHYQK